MQNVIVGQRQTEVNVVERIAPQKEIRHSLCSPYAAAMEKKVFGL